MARYSIDEKILTDLADGIRVVIGKEEGVPGFEEAIYEFSGQGNNSEGSDHTSNAVDFSFKVPGASYVLVKDIVITADTTDELYFKIGYTGDGRYNSLPEPAYRAGNDITPKEIVAQVSKVNNGLFWFDVRCPIENTNISISFTAIGLDGNQNVLVNKEVMIPYDLTPEEMVEEINGLSDLPLVPDEAFYYTGDCQNRFANGTLDWLINSYGDRITTEDITNVQQMFYTCPTITNIAFDINCKNAAMINMSSMFGSCYKLESVPKINGMPRPTQCDGIFKSCYKLRYLPEDIESWFDWSYLDTGSSYRFGANAFQDCFSLRSVPMGFLNHDCPTYGYAFYCIYQNLFSGCYSLDEIIGLPIPRPDMANWTSNYFSSTFSSCSRLKNMTFATNEDGSPIQVKWKNQVIDLVYAGYNGNADAILKNTEFTNETRINSEQAYKELKDNPDNWTDYYNYSRYNHDSAVRTINSLPDTTSSGGTNTIKFKGEAGWKTDGGAINTLTAEEIAVATAKGWTVSLV